jgi:hypothetical protein
LKRLGRLLVGDNVEVSPQPAPMAGQDIGIIVHD